MTKKQTETILKLKGFRLNSYPEGNFWEKIVNTAEKTLLARIFFGPTIGKGKRGRKGQFIAACDQNFSRCIAYYDGNVREFTLTDFMQGVLKIT